MGLRERRSLGRVPGLFCLCWQSQEPSSSARAGMCEDALTAAPLSSALGAPLPSLSMLSGLPGLQHGLAAHPAGSLGFLQTQRS